MTWTAALLQALLAYKARYQRLEEDLATRLPKVEEKHAKTP